MNFFAGIMNRLIRWHFLCRSRGAVRELDTKSRTARAVNKELLERILQDNAQTEYGRKYGFDRIKNAEDFRKAVPLTTYEDYAPYIDRMTEKGEKNLLTAYPVVYYASTSGTTGVPKKIPVTRQGLDLFHNYSYAFLAAVTEYYKSTQDADIPTGKFLVMLNLSKNKLPDGTEFGAISAAALSGFQLKLMRFFVSTPAEVMLCPENFDRRYFYARYFLEDREVCAMVGAYIPALEDILEYIWANHELLVKDIRTGTIDPGIQVPDELRKTLQEELGPNPERADEVAEAVAGGFDEGFVHRLWPGMSFVSAIWGGNFYVYARKMQGHTGRAIPYYTAAYVASEGIFGVARHPFYESYCLLPQSCFYEFIPVNEEEEREEPENPETLTIDQLEYGKAYEMVITNQSGFYRYRMGDVVRVTGFYNETPMISVLYRKKDVVSLVGEKLTEDHLHSAIGQFERRSGIRTVDYCMYSDRDGEPPRYVIFVEPVVPVPKEKRERAAEILGQELARASTSYAHYVITGELSAPRVVFLQSQTFLLYREAKMYTLGVSENQIKPVRVLKNDKEYKMFLELEDKE